MVKKYCEIQPKVVKYFYYPKCFLFYVRMYKMRQVSKEAYGKYKVEIIGKGKYFWVNRKDLEVESDCKNWAQISDKFDPKKQKYR